MSVETDSSSDAGTVKTNEEIIVDLVAHLSAAQGVPDELVSVLERTILKTAPSETAVATAVRSLVGLSESAADAPAEVTGE